MPYESSPKQADDQMLFFFFFNFHKTLEGSKRVFMYWVCNYSINALWCIPSCPRGKTWSTSLREIANKIIQYLLHGFWIKAYLYLQESCLPTENKTQNLTKNCRNEQELKSCLPCCHYHPHVRYTYRPGPQSGPVLDQDGVISTNMKNVSLLHPTLLLGILRDSFLAVCLDIKYTIQKIILKGRFKSTFELSTFHRRKYTRSFGLFPILFVLYKII